MPALRRLLPVLAATLLGLPPLPARPPADLADQLQALVKDGAGGVALAWVDRDGPVIVTAGTYAADDARPISADTRFELGSVSKVFTALLLAESERQGKAVRTDPAARHLLPAADPAQAALARVTLLSLTTHTSGLPRLPVNLGPDPDGNPDPYARYDRAQLVEALRLHGPTAPAGGPPAYSNLGVAVLGEALGRAWGTSYEEALNRHLLEPLGLKATDLALTGRPAPATLAPAHAGGRSPANWNFQAFAPAGGLRSSARDLATFLTFCLQPEGHPLAPALRATLQPQQPSPDTGGWIGLGWFLTENSGQAVAWHNGSTAGSRAFVAVHPATGTAVALAANRTLALEPLGFRLLGVTPPRPAPAAIADAAAFTGRYPLSPAFFIDVTTAGGVLFAQATGQPRITLRRAEGDRFRLTGVPAEISFHRDASGRVEALVLHQNGRDLRGPRQPLPAEPKVVTLPRETLRGYAGRYALSANFVLTVTEADGNLFVQATGQPKAPVFASAPDEFFYRVVAATLTFQRGPDGQVTGLVLHQNGRDLPGRRQAD